MTLIYNFIGLELVMLRFARLYRCSSLDVVPHHVWSRAWQLEITLLTHYRSIFALLRNVAGKLKGKHYVKVLITLSYTPF